MPSALLAAADFRLRLEPIALAAPVLRLVPFADSESLPQAGSSRRSCLTTGAARNQKPASAARVQRPDLDTVLARDNCGSADGFLKVREDRASRDVIANRIGLGYPKRSVDLVRGWQRKPIGGDVRHLAGLHRYWCYAKRMSRHAAEPKPIFRGVQHPTDARRVVIVEFTVQPCKDSQHRISRGVARLQPLENWPSMGAVADDGEPLIPDDALVGNVGAVRRGIRAAGVRDDLN